MVPLGVERDVQAQADGLVGAVTRPGGVAARDEPKSSSRAGIVSDVRPFVKGARDKTSAGGDVAEGVPGCFSAPSPNPAPQSWGGEMILRLWREIGKGIGRPMSNFNLPHDF